MTVFYRLLLRLYPASFRTEYGGQMQAIFEKRLRGRGAFGRAALSAASVGDVASNALRAHLDILRQDVRHTARSLARSPGFAATAVLVAALGIGATTATFSLLDHALLRPLPFPEPERLVRLWQDQSFRGYREMEVSPPNYRDWKRMSRSFQAVGADMGFSANLVGRGKPRRLEGAAVTSELLPLLGAPPALGRVFTADDDRAGAPGTLVISDALWRSQFGADPAAVGQSILLDDDPFTIVGVMPATFAFPNRSVQFWAPLRMGEEDLADRTNLCYHVVGRLKPGVSLETASSEMRGIAAQLERAYPKENARTGVTVVPLSRRLSAQSRLLVTALFGAALAVLLIACTNLASLLLARGIARRRELAVRSALGAGRDRLLRQLLTESLLLAFAGGALGVALAAAAAPVLALLVPGRLPVTGSPSVDPRVLVFAAVLTTVTGILFGVLPALRACGDAHADALRDGERAGAGRRAERLRSVLVVAEVTASVALLGAAGLLTRALWKLQSVDPGFRTDGVLTLQTSLPLPGYDKTARRQAFYDRVLADVKALPGVLEAGYISFLPMTMTGGIWPVETAGGPAEAAEARVASLRFVTPGFFDAMGIPLRAGRRLAESDTPGSPRVAVVSESFVKQNIPGESPIGHRFHFAFEDREIVGIAADIRVRGLERTSEPQVYLPHRQMADGSLTWFAPKDLVVRSAVAPASLTPAIREIVAKADPRIPISEVRLLSDVVEADTAPRQIQARVLGAFAATALLLAGIGIHGLLAFTVSQRSREIGVRVALGAQPRDVLEMVVRRGLLLAAIGVGLGAALAYGAGRAMQTLLVGISPADLPAFLAAGAAALLMTLAGCLAPAIRAVRLDPIAAIRSE